jgi:hypothetical protein
MMTETLRIDTGLVLEAGGRLQGVAGAIPAPPASFSPPGADALSTAIAGKVAEVVDPVIAQMPITKEEMVRYAQNVVNAANTYDAVDRQIAEEILERLRALDLAKPMDGGGATRGGSGTGGGGSAARATAATEAAGTAASPAASQAAGAAQQAGQMGQMMQLPMQMAQQAAQIPMQMAGMAAAIPAAMIQGVQSALQQAGQVSEMSGEEKPDDSAAQTPGEVDAKRVDEPERAEEPPADQAAPGGSTGERAPEQQQPTPQPAPKPAPTRPAQSPEIAL